MAGDLFARSSIRSTGPGQHPHTKLYWPSVHTRR
jgi:hypothetical protein